MQALPPGADQVPLQHDDQKVKDYGVQLSVSMIRRLIKETDIRGVHFCTLNLEKSVQRVLETLEWVPYHTPVMQNKLISVRLPPAARLPSFNRNYAC